MRTDRPKAYSYLRFSTPEQAGGDSLRRQMEKAEAYADEHSLDLDTELTFKDLGISAYNGKNAQTGALSLFLRAAEDRLIPPDSYLLVESLDRISRDNILNAQAVFMSIVAAGVTLVTLADGRRFSRASINANPTDLIISIVTLMRAHEESATKAMRLRAAWEAKRARAFEEPMTSRGPAWLRLEGGEWKVIEERADVIRRIYREAAEGCGQNVIARRLNEDEVPTFGDSTRDAARHWHRSYVAKLLKSEAVIGTFTPHTVYHSETGQKLRRPSDPIPGYYPLIVEPDVFDRVRALTAGASRNPQRGAHSGKTIRNVLGGLAHCPKCGGSMTRVTKGSHTKAGRPYLVCSRAKVGAGCKYRAVPLDGIEKALIENADFIAAGDGSSTSLPDLDAAIQALVEENDELEHRFWNLAMELSRQPSDRLRQVIDRIVADQETIKEDLLELRSRRSRSSRSIVQKRLSTLSDALGTRPFDPAAANVALRALLDRVVVGWPLGLMRLDWSTGGYSVVRIAEAEDAEDKQVSALFPSGALTRGAEAPVMPRKPT